MQEMAVFENNDAPKAIFWCFDLMHTSTSSHDARLIPKGILIFSLSPLCRAQNLNQ